MRLSNELDVLFIGHYAGRTGAPLLMLWLQQWLKANTNLHFATLLLQPGALADQYAALGETAVIGPVAPQGHTGILSDRLRTFRRKQLLRHWRSRHPRLVYSNTITNGSVVAEVVRPGVPVITHVHEMDHWILRSGRDNWKDVRSQTIRFIAVSDAVARTLADRHGVPRDVTEVIHEFVRVDAGVAAGARDRVRARLGIPPSAFVVGGSGIEDLRKGKDLFVQLARVMESRRPQREVRFLWVGPASATDAGYWVKHDAERIAGGDRITWTGEVDNPLDYLAAVDVFAMVSREDPFPLVSLEAAALGKPVVCFAGAGGTPELVEQDAGAIVPYLDLDTMVDRLLEFASSEPLRVAMGQCGAAKVRERFSEQVIAPRLYGVIQRVLADSDGKDR